MFWDRASIELGAKQSLDKMFSAILVGGIDRTKSSELFKLKMQSAKTCISRFRSMFHSCIFSNEYAIFYQLIVNKNLNIFTVDQMNSIINTNRDLVLDSPYINKADFMYASNGNVASDDDIISAFVSILKDKLMVFSLEIVPYEEFESACTIYEEWFRRAYGQYIANNMAAIMSDVGYEDKKPGKRRRFYHGLDDMNEYYREEKAILDSIGEGSKLTTQLIDAKWLKEDIEADKDKDTMNLIGTGLKEIDSITGPQRRGYVLGVLGPPKGGKTRFSAHMAYRALASGLNVLVWPLEGSQEEWISMILSSLLGNLSYEKVKENNGRFEQITSDVILQRKYTYSDSMRSKVIVAKQMLATSENFGRLSFITGTAYVEDFLDVLKNHYNNENPFDVVIIDSLVNIMSLNGRGKAERISEAYMKFKDFVANGLKQPALGIVPAQLKQEVIDFIRRNPEETLDVTSGGESAETIRTPDLTIGLFSNKMERENNIMKVYGIANRHSAIFNDFQCRCYLGSCMFLSAEESS